MKPLRRARLPLLFLVAAVLFDAAATFASISALGISYEVNPLARLVYSYAGVLGPFLYAPLEYLTFGLPVLLVNLTERYPRARAVVSFALALYPVLGALTNVRSLM